MISIINRYPRINIMTETTEDSSVYRGKVKLVEPLNEKKVRITFTDDITAGDGAKMDNLEGKGSLNMQMSNHLMEVLEESGIPTHLLEIESNNSVIARKVDIFPIEVVIRNIAAGSFCRRYGLEEGIDLDEPILEFFVKDDELHDPLIDRDVVLKQNMATKQELTLIMARARQVNQVLSEYFKKANMLLVDFKLEFGIDNEGHIYLADEVSGDSMRVWDANTREKLDKDRFRKDLGDVLAGYKAIIDRLEKVDYEPSLKPIKAKINISPKESISDPAGQVTQRTLVNSGLDNIGTTNIGKMIEIVIEDPSGHEWIDQLDEVTQNLLTNPLIEDYELEFE